MGKKKEFNDFRFEDLNYANISNKYFTMDRVNENEDKIVVKVGEEHLLKTKFGYALILDLYHVLFLKDWQVDENYFGNEVLLTKEFFKPKKWGEHIMFSENEDNLFFEQWLNEQKNNIKQGI